MLFVNHTAKGITSFIASATDRYSGQNRADIVDKILDLAKEADKKIRYDHSQAPSMVAKNSMLSFIPINGKYDLLDIILYPMPSKIETRYGEMCVSTLEFPVFSQPYQEGYAESYSRARNIAAILCLLTQNLFIANYSDINLYPIKSNSKRQKKPDKIPKGSFIPDDGLIENQIHPDKDNVIDLHQMNDQSISKDIVEPRDCVIDGTIAFPRRVQQAMRFILDDISTIQAARRFQEALIFQREMAYDPNHEALGDLLTPYQLIAFVAAIEAIIDTSPREVKQHCPICNQTFAKKERQIAKSFREFVAEMSDGNEVFKKIFNQVYNDRSKFVHTGKDLYNPTALRPHRPLILDGKDFLEPRPSYYPNLPDFVGWLLRRYVYRTMTDDMVSDAVGDNQINGT